LTGRPCRHRGLPPPPPLPPPLALEHHGYSSSYLVRSHDALELSFRSERSQLPGLALWAACAAASRNRKHRKYCPQDRKPTWEMSSPKRISLPPWEPRGFLQRRDRSPNECTSGAFFECKGTHYDRRKKLGRIGEELRGKATAVLGVEYRSWGWEPTPSIGGDRSIDRSIEAPGLRLGLDRGIARGKGVTEVGKARRPRWHGCGAFRVLVGRETRVEVSGLVCFAFGGS